MFIKLDRKQQNKFRLSPVAHYALAAAVFGVLCAWLALLTGCLYGLPEACAPRSYGLAALGVPLLICLVMAWIHMRRAIKRATKGEWRGAAGRGWWKTLERSVRVAWASEDDQSDLITGLLREERRRWLVPVANGQRVWVDRKTFWRWLQEVEKLAQTLPAGRSPVAKRLWEGRTVEGQKLKEGDLLAFCVILEACGRFHYARDDRRSRQFVSRSGAAAWGTVESYEGIQESEVY